MIDAFKTNGSSPPSCALDALPPRIREKIRVNAETGCWEWVAYRHPDGYGQVRWAGHKQQSHRVVYQLLVGPILEETLDHLCRVRHCVNPAHLEQVSNRVNTLRGETIPALNAAKTHCPQGHQYNAENTYTDPHGQRYCRTCQCEYQRAYRARTKQAHLSLVGAS